MRGCLLLLLASCASAPVQQQQCGWYVQQAVIDQRLACAKHIAEAVFAEHEKCLPAPAALPICSCEAPPKFDCSKWR